ncbi:MAG: MATE family efflux transporter [Oscillospiraceae bacterium]
MLRDKLRKNFIFEKPFIIAVITIALPIAAQNIISFGVSVMDSIMLGSFGDVAISAANLGGQPFFILMSVGFGLSSGGSVLIAQYWGKHDIAHIRKVMRMSMQFVFIASVIFTLGCMLFPAQIMSIFSPDKDIISAAAGYLSLVALSYVPYAISNNYLMSLRAVEQVKVSTFIYLISFFINVIFNYGFIFGKFGLPRLEVRGAALGTVIARCSELLMVLIYMYTREKEIGFRITDCFKTNWELLPSYVKHSVPVVGNEVMWGVGTTMITLIIGRISGSFLAANSIAGVVNQMALVFVFGVGNAAAILTGKAIGEGNIERSKRVANTLIVIAFCLSIFSCAALLLARLPFLSIYKVTQETHDIAYNIMTVLAFLQLSISIEVTTIVGVLRGGGDTRTAFFIDCGCLWLIGLPMGLLAGFVFKLSPPLVYLCLRMDSPIKSILTLIRIRSGKWVRNVTIGEQKRRT